MSLDELHAFAVRAGLHPRSFEGDHYDVPQERYGAVLAAGATSTTGADVVRRLIASGLRLRKRRGDRPVARIPVMVFPDGTRASVDLVESDRPVTAPACSRPCASCRTRPAGSRWSTRRVATRGFSGRVARSGRVGPRGRGARDPGGDRTRGPGATHLEVCAYERFTVDGEVRGRWLPGRSYLQVYRTRVSGTAPAMAGTEDDVDGWRWVDRAGFERLCGADFWWPLVPRLFG